MQARFDAIVDFADLGDYIDTPLKRYSSGMYARLGFAVAAYVDPDVLLVDEVLSVGDVGFQDRSIRKMLSFRDSGQTILFVSHNLSAVEMMCQRTVWLDHGSVRMAGADGRRRARVPGLGRRGADRGNDALGRRRSEQRSTR